MYQNEVAKTRIKLYGIVWAVESVVADWKRWITIENPGQIDENENGEMFPALYINTWLLLVIISHSMFH